MSEDGAIDEQPVGVFGLGNMGLALATRLAIGRPVIAYDPSPERRQLVAPLAAVRAVPKPEQVTTETVVLSLPATRISHEIVDLVTERAPGGLIVETSTVNPWDAEAMAARAAERSWSFVDAAILSGVAQMYDGSAAMLIGGSDADVARAQPVVDALSSRQRHLGPVGAGMAAKVVNNAVAHAVMIVLVEAGALAASCGVSGVQLTELLQEPDGGLIRPLTHRYVERILNGNFDGGMPTDVARKDSVLALELAQRTRVPMFAIQAAHSVYELAVSAGLARLDYASVATLWEAWTGRPLTDGSTAQEST